MLVLDQRLSSIGINVSEFKFFIIILILDEKMENSSI